MSTELKKYENTQKEFELVCKNAGSISIAQNASAAFEAVIVVKSLKDLLTDEVMNEVFMPLMNTKIGFLTDRNGKPNSKGETKALYSISTVRDAIVDAVCFGLLPTFNQFNIIADRMYPTKEGYTALLKKIGVKYVINIGSDKNTSQQFAEMDCAAAYEYNGEKKNLPVKVSVKKDSYSSPDQLRGKAERRVKKALFEYITGCDFGDADENSGELIDITKHQKQPEKQPRETYETEQQIKEDQLKGAITKEQAEELLFNFTVSKENGK